MNLLDGPSKRRSAADKRAALREGLAKPDRPVITIGAHDAMSALLVEKYGFDAVWVSGFGVSTMQHGLPDLNLVTLTEAVDAAVRIDQATSLPVVADCDNGYGGLLNVVRTALEYERAGIAGICVEDNLFPKRNSLFLGETKRDLVPIDEQAQRIRAAKDHQETEDFTFIARVEALIAGHGVEAALERALAFSDAGADAILIHSKDRTLSEIEGFLEGWDGRKPLVAVPTLFPDFTAEQLHERGLQMVILANQTMRAAVSAMERTLETLSENSAAASVDPDIAPVNHVFDLVGTSEAIALDEQGS